MATRPQLYHLVHLWISLTRHLQETANPRDHDHFGTHASDLLIRAAVYLGTIEGRPMTATKLSTHVGIPRPTVVRHLRSLQRRGLVEATGRHAWRTAPKLIDLRGKQDFSALAKIVRSANTRLQKP